MMLSLTIMLMPLPDVLSEDHSLHRISIQITKAQYGLLKKYSRPGISISSMIRRSIDDMFAPVIDQALKEAEKQELEDKRKSWKKQPVRSGTVVSEAPEIDLGKG